MKTLVITDTMSHPHNESSLEQPLMVSSLFDADCDWDIPCAFGWNRMMTAATLRVHHSSRAA
jgi:hypothetical protein